MRSPEILTGCVRVGFPTVFCILALMGCVTADSGNSEVGTTAEGAAPNSSGAESTAPATPLPNIGLGAEQEEQARVAEMEELGHALASRLAARGTDAHRGDLLDPALSSYIERVTRALVEGGHGADILEALKDGNPAFDEPEAATPIPTLQVNAPYPDEAPLSMVPPDLLSIYPPLPDGVEYRFVGCRLILLDRDSRLILDYTEECIW